jgi:hypothetical protein
MQRLDYELRVDNLVTPQSVASTTVNTNAGMYRDMKLYRKGLVVIVGEIADGQTCVAQLTCDVGATATAGKANVTNKTVTLTGASGATSQVGSIEFDVNDLTAIAATKHFVGVDLTTDSTQVVSAVLLRGAARYYQGASMPV